MNELHAQMINDCEKRESRLSEWEQGFIDSISRRDSLTSKQIDALERVWEKATEEG